MSGLGAEVGAAIKLLELASKEGWLDKVKNVFKKRHQVLVLGTTGAGKTQFLTALTKMVPEAIDIINRTKFATKHDIKVSKSLFDFVDTPGDDAPGYRDRRIREIRKAMAGGVTGVINVVSYGYHEYDVGSKIPVNADGSTKEAFLKKHRQFELDALYEWTELLGAPETTNWMITVVTKADLWWDRRKEVMGYYISGDYYDALNGMQAVKPVALEFCSVFHKFFGQGAMSGIFDESDRNRARANLLQQLLSAVGKVKNG